MGVKLEHKILWNEKFLLHLLMKLLNLEIH